MSILLSCLFSWINNPQVIIIMTKVFIQRKILPVNTILNALEIRLEKKKLRPTSTQRCERKTEWQDVYTNIIQTLDGTALKRTPKWTHLKPKMEKKKISLQTLTRHPTKRSSSRREGPLHWTPTKSGRQCVAEPISTTKLRIHTAFHCRL